MFHAGKAIFAATNCMNELRTIFSGRQYLLILMSFLMLAATGYRPVNPEVLGLGNVEVQQSADDEENSSSDEDITILSNAYEAIVPVCKIQVNFVYNTVLELKLIEEIVESVRMDLPLPQSSYFRILFGTFISPNAP